MRGQNLVSANVLTKEACSGGNSLNFNSKLIAGEVSLRSSCDKAEFDQ